MELILHTLIAIGILSAAFIIPVACLLLIRPWFLFRDPDGSTKVLLKCIMKYSD